MAVLVMKTLLTAVFLSVASLSAAAAGIDVDEFLDTLTNNVSVGAYAQLDSAYISSGNSIGDSRPVLQQCVSVAKSFGEFGRLSSYLWTPTSLNRRNDQSHRRAYYWLECGVNYSYSWKFCDSLSLYSRPLFFWGVPTGDRTERHSNFCCKFTQRLDNPIVSPYYCLYGRFTDLQWWQVSLGLMREFKLADTLTLTPTLEFVCNDERRYRARYGIPPPSLSDRLSAMVARITLKWWFVEHWNAYVILKQFDTLGHDSREAVKRQSSHTALRDLTSVSVGVACSF
jgi:hypothetical protein